MKTTSFYRNTGDCPVDVAQVMEYLRDQEHEEDETGGMVWDDAFDTWRLLDERCKRYLSAIRSGLRDRDIYVRSYSLQAVFRIDPYLSETASDVAGLINWLHDRRRRFDEGCTRGTRSDEATRLYWLRRLLRELARVGRNNLTVVQPLVAMIRNEKQNGLLIRLRATFVQRRLTRLATRGRR